MSQSLSNIVVHLVFGTKNRQPILRDDIRDELHAYLIGILKAYGCKPIITNSEPEHVHQLFVLSKTHALSFVIEKVKNGSSKWLKTKGLWYAKFYWQDGFGAFSVSESDVESVKRYIANQH